jgi:hypothetical protein
VRFIEPNQRNLIQAELEKFSNSTNERKQMSTKTAFKRIALVTVAALGFGVLSSVAPASAVVNNPVYAVDYAASTIELGQDAVLVLHQDFLGDTAAQVVMTFTVTQNVYGADTTTASTNLVMPKVYLGSATGTVSTGSTTNSELARGYAAAAVYSGFPAADIAASKVNINNTQTGGTTTGTALTSTVVNEVTAAAAGIARTRERASHVAAQAIYTARMCADHAFVDVGARPGGPTSAPTNIAGTPKRATTIDPHPRGNGWPN